MKFPTALLFTLSLVVSSFAQLPFDTTGGRFRVPVFDSVEVISNIQYSRSVNVSGQMQDLVLDVYQPFGDAATQRPVMVMVHGGSFLQGNKLDLALTCRHFAQKGYVAVSIQYRLGYSSFTPAAAVQTVIRATQDLKNAIRFLRKSASLTNPYKIHPDFVFAGGVSAGAITALHAAYMDELSEILPGQTILTLDSLHNTNQIPGFDWRFKAVINIAGGLGDTNWIKPGNVPVTSFHGTADATVPYETGSFGGSFALYGSHPIFLRTQHIGIPSELRPFPGAGHDYTIDNPGAGDTTLQRITRFLFPQLLQPVTIGVLPSSPESTLLHLTPNGWLITPKTSLTEYQLFDAQGRLEQNHRQSTSEPFIVPFRSWTRIIRFGKDKREWKILPGMAE